MLYNVKVEDNIKEFVMTTISKEWYKLDNAAKIYPASVSKKNTATFRMAVYLKEDIDPVKLQYAVETVVPFFPTMAVTMMNGLFWHYLQPTMRMPKVQAEIDRPCRRINAYKNNGYHFRVMYYGNKIALETFHVLTDGTGAITFLKAIVRAYLDLPINQDYTKKESTEDSFKKYYKSFNKIKERPKAIKAAQLKTEALPIEGVIAHHGIISSKELKQKAKALDVTITVYLAAQYIYAMYKHRDQMDTEKHPIVLSIPINLRRRFPSVSIRNFSYFANVAVDIEKVQNLRTIIKSVKEQLIKGTDSDLLYSQIHSNVKIESNIFFRIIPNIMKTGILKVAKNIFSGKNFTSNFSNLGIVTVEDDLKDYIDYFEFTLNAASPFNINLATCTYEDKLVMTVSKRIKDRQIVDTFFDAIEKDVNSKINRYTNEEEDEVKYE